MLGHRVELVQLGRAALERLHRDAGRARDLRELGLRVRQELVQRRVEQAYGDGQARHHLQDAHEIGALLG